MNRRTKRKLKMMRFYKTPGTIFIKSNNQYTGKKTMFIYFVAKNVDYPFLIINNFNSGRIFINSIKINGENYER